MAITNTAEVPSGRDKMVTKIPPMVRRKLKVRAATVGMDIQDAVSQGIEAWLSAEHPLPPVDTASSQSFSTYVPADTYATFRDACANQKLPYNQGVIQAIELWLAANPLPQRAPRSSGARRIVFGNQKGGVGKTALTSGVGQALAEMGFTVCLVDFDPQGHLTKQLDFRHLDVDADSLVKHMVHEREVDLGKLLLRIEGDAFGDRLFLLPACTDGFLLDAKIVTCRGLRIKETALEQALAPLESEFDYILIDCPPSLGYAMDNALYYGRTREGEEEGLSGLFIPVQAEDSSVDAYDLLRAQIDSLQQDMKILICDLGFIVNLYDSRKGFVLTSGLQYWEEMGEPPVVAVLDELKDQREAVRMRRPLLDMHPEGEQADVMRSLARRIV